MGNKGAKKGKGEGEEKDVNKGRVMIRRRWVGKREDEKEMDWNQEE